GKADGAHEAQRIVLEDGLRDRAHLSKLQVLTSTARIEMLSSRDRQRNRVDREIAAEEICLDRSVDRREVDRTAAPVHATPRRVLLRKHKRRAARLLRVGTSCLCGIAADDVDVDDTATEELVADGTADEPRFLTPQDLADEVIHRGS